MRVPGTEAAGARPPQDGNGRRLPAVQPARAPPTLVQVHEVEAAHVAGHGAGVVGLVHTRKPGAAEFVPQEARGATGRAGNPGVVSAERVSVLEDGRPLSHSAARRAQRREPTRRGAVAVASGVPLFLADVGVGGPAPECALRRHTAVTGGAQRKGRLVPMPRPAAVALLNPRRSPSAVVGSATVGRAAVPATCTHSPAARGEVLDRVLQVPIRGRSRALARGPPRNRRVQPAVGPPPAGPATPRGVAGVLPTRRAGSRRSRSHRRSIARPRRPPVPAARQRTVLAANANAIVRPSGLRFRRVVAHRPAAPAARGGAALQPRAP